jgi:hypothetical protein
MAGLDPKISFNPAVDKTFDKHRVIVVKDAMGEQLIRRWDKLWKPAQGNRPKAPVIYMTA